MIARLCMALCPIWHHIVCNHHLTSRTAIIDIYRSVSLDLDSQNRGSVKGLYCEVGRYYGMCQVQLLVIGSGRKGGMIIIYSDGQNVHI